MPDNEFSEEEVSQLCNSLQFLSFTQLRTVAHLALCQMEIKGGVTGVADLCPGVDEADPGHMLLLHVRRESREAVFEDAREMLEQTFRQEGG